MSPGRNLEIAPTLTAVRTDLRDQLPDGPWVTAESDVDLGLTARWGFTPNLTLSGAHNPDFSQVEADARQLEVNQPFALFFPEKRPFFMEGADFFESPLDVVYTRMMRDPAWGLKLSGKEGPHTVGGYVARDQITNLIIPGSQNSDGTSLPIDNTSTVLRYKHDIGSRHTVGGLFTDRQGGDYFNRVVGVDGDFRLSPTDRIITQLLGSSTQYPDQVAEDFDQPAGRFQDAAFELLYLHETRSLNWWAEYTDVGTDFRADLGFMPQVDYVNTRDGDQINLDGGLQYRFGEHLQFEGMYTYEKMKVDEGLLYDANIGQVLVAWHFSARTFVRAIVQHVAYDFNVELYTDGRDPEYRELFGQFLFSYMLNPRTVIFVGYTEESLGNQDYALSGAARSVFAKIGYAWVF